MNAEPTAEAQQSIPYLSETWLTEADQLLDGLPPIGEAVTIAVVVTDGPNGDRRYRTVLGPDRVSMTSWTDGAVGDGTEGGVGGDGADGGVRMTMHWDVAVAVATGRASAQRAFLDGDLQLGGDASLLLGHQQELAAIEDRLAPLRAITRYD